MGSHFSRSCHVPAGIGSCKSQYHKSSHGKPGEKFENGIGCLMSDLEMSDLKVKSDITNHQIRNFLSQTSADSKPV
jgi:hypothetical protein